MDKGSHARGIRAEPQRDGESTWISPAREPTVPYNTILGLHSDKRRWSGQHRMALARHRHNRLDDCDDTDSFAHNGYHMGYGQILANSTPQSVHVDHVPQLPAPRPGGTLYPNRAPRLPKLQEHGCAAGVPNRRG